jgi:hypothetical protein
MRCACFIRKASLSPASQRDRSTALAPSSRRGRASARVMRLDVVALGLAMLGLPACGATLDYAASRAATEAVEAAIRQHPEREGEVMAYVSAMGGAFCTLGLSRSASPSEVIVQLDESTVPLQRTLPAELIGAKAAMITAYLGYAALAQESAKQQPSTTAKGPPMTVKGARTLCRIVADVLIDRGQAPVLAVPSRAPAAGDEPSPRAAAAASKPAI